MHYVLKAISAEPHQIFILGLPIVLLKVCMHNQQWVKSHFSRAPLNLYFWSAYGVGGVWASGWLCCVYVG